MVSGQSVEGIKKWVCQLSYYAVHYVKPIKALKQFLSHRIGFIFRKMYGSSNKSENHKTANKNL
jgi:hypothetical protein